MSDDNAIAPVVVNSLQTNDFNYDALEMEDRSVVKFHADVIKERIRRTTQDIIEIGERLIDVKDRLPHGQFTLWLQVEFSWDERTARRFMAVAAMFKTDTVSVLSKDTIDKVSIDQSALYILAAKSTPQEIRREILERAYQGEQFTKSKVKQIVIEHKGKRSSVKTKRRSLDKSLIVGKWVQVQTIEGNKDWDGFIGQIVKPLEFGKVGVKLNETNWRCLQFFPEELTVVEAPIPYKPGDMLTIALTKRVDCSYKQYNGCWSIVNRIGESGHLELQIAGRKMFVMTSDVDPIDNPSETFKEVAQKVNQLMGLEELDDLDRQTLDFFLRKQVFNEKQLQRLDQIWSDYFNNEPS